MRKSSVNIWHAALLLLAFSIISFAATPFLFTTIGQAAPTLSLISAACATDMATLIICVRLMDISCTVSTKTSQKIKHFTPGGRELECRYERKKTI